jgi:wyosine [tRNA(Phe)-imidazoG37] synthetase (radical SAM superfamily)
MDYYPPHEIVAEVKQAIIEHQPGEIDWITFVGSGEPTLHASIGWMIRRIKEFTNLPIAVITNGSFLSWDYHRRELACADAVMPSLDAGNARLYHKINRPHPYCKFDRHVEGLEAFSNQYYGELWIEVMLVKGLNDGENELKEIATVLSRIQPDQIHINLPNRPPVESWVQPPEEEGILGAKKFFGDIAKLVTPVGGKFDLGEGDDIVEAIVGIITRHPMQEAELIRAIDSNLPGEVTRALEELKSSGKAQVVERYGNRFWSAAPAYFPQ